MQNSVSFKKRDVFCEKNCFSKIAQGSKLAVECDGKSEIFQNVQNLAFSQKNTLVIPTKSRLFKNRQK